MFDLKIIGSPLKKSEIDFLNQIIPERWSVESNIDNAKLNSFYNNAFALLYPSSYEGFGIPILEAMKAGTPFIALNNSSIPEVAGNAGILLDSLNIEDFMNALHKISLNRLNLIEKGFIQSQKFSWDKCFQQTLKVYNDLYNS
ncbi:glycosyltransferase [bacterium]|nr:MAG: glycosyltransferase [bacterium]